IGAGSAGCILANRLSADGKHSVCVLEAGPPDRNIYIHIPAGFIKNISNPSINWMYQAESNPHINNRKMPVPRGKTLGGSSSINGMIYNRGQRMDYDSWAQQGNRGWGYADVLPYFKRCETNSRGESAWRGGSGPVATQSLPIADPLNRAFVDAGEQAGYLRTDDVNGFQQEGFGPFDMNVDNGIRASTAHAYINPARGRPNLTVRTKVSARRIVMEGRKAVGVEIDAGGQRETLMAAREIIISASAFSTPHLLMLSGIGPADHLREHGIKVLRDLPGVGANLQDHLEVHVQWAGELKHSRNRHARPIAKVMAGARWFLDHDGVCASNQVEVGAFTRSSPDKPHPDIQYHFFPFLLDGWGASTTQGGFCLCVGTLREHSRGTVRLASSDPTQRPLINFNFLDDPRDLEDLRACVHQARDIASQAAFDPFREKAVEPWASAKSDAEIDQLIRETAESAYHPSGSCKMGTDAMAVVDPKCRVHGIENLRIVDSSIMPSVTSGNLNAPTMMIGEKAADIILGRDPLPPSNAGFCGTG
ncbi:MAG: choline dehydrogenase, partial [Rhodospirillaceae bacterium]|nr:choline dehydrogenase [Rhodospirillaceae bacterium]